MKLLYKISFFKKRRLLKELEKEKKVFYENYRKVFNSRNEKDYLFLHKLIREESKFSTYIVLREREIRKGINLY